MQKVIVFGGSGFLGSHVADVLSEKGYQVIIFDRAKSTYLKDSQKMVVGDILDRGQIRNVINGADYVYHFAALADIDEAKNKPIETVKINVLGTVNILDACKEFKVKRFIYGSTVYVYSEHGSFYRSSKQSSELFIENYKKIYDLDYTILRFGSLYGRRANKFNSIRNIIRQALLEKKITRDGDGNEVRDYINVFDAARISVNILNDDYKNSHIMITGTQTLKVKELLNMINEMFDNEIEIEFSGEKQEEHYEITPYSFRPRVAKKYILKDYHDLGQGILDAIYDIYKDLSEDDINKILIKNPNIKVNNN